MSDYMPGAVQSPQPGGGGLNGALPPRATWHITWDALKPDGSQPAFSAVSGYLKNVGYCPHIMWNPFTGYIEQFYPASQSARALVAWNEDGAVNVQIETFFTPGCVVDGVKYATVADTPCVGLGTILDWLDGMGIPRVWPMGAPQWQGNSRDTSIWNTQAGHYGHCNVPDNTHTDPGPMPALGGITTQGTITVQEDTLSAAEVDAIVSEANKQSIETRRIILEALGAVPGNVLNQPVPYKDPTTGKDTGQSTSLATVAGFTDFQHNATRTGLPAAVLNQGFTLPDGTVTNLAGILAAIHAKPTGGTSIAPIDAHAVASAVLTSIQDQWKK